MSCQWIVHFALTIVIATSMAGRLFAQYQDYPSSPRYETNPPQLAQLPWWNSEQPQQFTSSQPVPAPRAHSPSEMPSVNPFANVNSHQQQISVNTGSMSTPPATDSYYAYPTTYGVQPEYAVGDGMPHPDPPQQAIPSPHPPSFHDHPAQNYWQQPEYGFDPKDASCSTLVNPGCRSGWYAGALGLIMSRNRENNLWLSFDQFDVRDRVLNSHDADFDYAGGSGASIGHYFNCGRNSIQLIYWGIYPGRSEANAYWTDTIGGLDTPLHFDGLQYDAGSGAQDVITYIFDAERHRLRRNYAVYNVELNLLGHNFVPACGPFQLGWTAGVRYFRFDEDFLFSSDPSDIDFTGAPEEIHYSIDVENNLVGFQIGGRADYCIGSRLSLFTDTKLGVYGNHISHRSRLYGAYGNAGSPYYGEDLDVASTKDTFSMIGELLVGANWRFGPCWSINAGYRAVAVNGVALSTNQVPADYIGELDSIRAVDSNGSLILHGAFAGINFCY